MSRAATSIELVGYPEASVRALAATQPSSIHSNTKDAPSEDVQPVNGSIANISAEQRETPGKGTTAIVLITVVCVTMVSSMLSGVTAVTLPTMARELELAPSVLFW
jgi:hypothetical protein